VAKILVTGGAGFVGSVVVRHLLERSHRVRVLDSLMYGGSSLLGLWNDPGADIVVGDLNDRGDRARALEGMEGVVHLAAIVGDPACSRRPEEARRVNLEGTRELVAEARAAGVARFVFASTCSNYGVSSPDALVDEDSPLNPISLYAETKVAAERLVLDAADDRFDPIVLRLSTVYGVSPRMRFDLLVNDFTREAFARRKIVIYGQQFWRPHVHVFDVARAVAMAVEAPPDRGRPRVFNVGQSDQNFQKQAIAELAAAQVPGTALVFVHKDEDPRSYRVRFDRVRDVFGFQLTRCAEDGVTDVLRLLRAGVITDYDEPKYSN
jgi:nucleoside-diphosphate-sugar epimerase